MSDEPNRNSFEDALRAIAQEVNRGIERLSEVDLDEVARTTGLDPDKAKDWFDSAGTWLRVRIEQVDPSSFTMPGTPAPAPADDEPTAARTPGDDPLRGFGPHPLDVPTAEQGVALAALDSGRWTIEPGTSALAVHGDGPGPRDALGLVRELRVRDWLDVDGQITLAGRHALSRWLETTDR
ncbi:hypothetical protein [Capillimicrobium parvum]|uniref:Uncharacterized protein n=1 Tax=Capillimicrobium parvum TaxID=2884022 RepID=A0A9E6XYM2_9ACTN|nr:hypothetical protein [Capillimicrobium parvum]UGS36368.1 hypothetical protein DSM104329_02772 [Capillimicrobium parvum]